MKEVLTKRFWQDVKKTFYEALEEPPPENKLSAAPVASEGSPTTPSTPETPAPPDDGN